MALTYIRAQPAALRRVFADVPPQVAAVRATLPSHPGAVMLVGTGTSRHALLGVEALFARRWNCPVIVTGPMAFITERPFSATAGNLAIILSQSGASTTTIEAVDVARARGMTTLVITAEADSDIAALPGPRVIMPIGPETAGPKTKGYTASLATLMCVALGEDIPNGEAVVRVIEDRLPAWQAWSLRLAIEYRQARHILVLALGRHVATAQEAAIKITEMSGVPAAAFELEEALHGRFHGLDATSPVFFIARPGDEAALARATMGTLQELGMPVHLVAVGDGGDVSVEAPTVAELPELDLIPAIVPFQLFAHDLAVARGMNPERMRYPDLEARLGIKTTGRD